MRRQTRLILLAVAVCGAAAARQEVRRDFRKTANLPAGRLVRIESSLGRISVHGTQGHEVAVQAVTHCSADTMDEAQRICGQIQIVFEESAAGVSVRTEYPHLSGRFHNLSYAVDYEITMPDTAPLDLRNRFGAVDVVDLHAPATINNGNGNVTFIGGRGQQRIDNSFGMVEVRKNEGDLTINNGNGPTIAAEINGAVEITNRFAEIRVTNAAKGVTIRSNNSNIQVTGVGGAAWISNSFGRVTVADVKGNVTVQNQNGEIDATRITGAADLHTTFAGIHFSQIGKTLNAKASNSLIRGDTVGDAATVETTFGGVDIRDVKGAARVTGGNAYVKLASIAGEVYAKTTFAPVNITDAAGPITVEGQNGAVTVVGRPGPKCQPISLKTTFSPIRLTIPQGQGYNVTAHTTFGHIHSDPQVVMTVSGDIDQKGLVGKINGGGCDLRLTGQNGNIDIVR